MHEPLRVSRLRRAPLRRHRHAGGLRVPRRRTTCCRASRTSWCPASTAASNLSNDVMYSGTVAAAREARVVRHPVDRGEPVGRRGRPRTGRRRSASRGTSPSRSLARGLPRGRAAQRERAGPSRPTQLRGRARRAARPSVLPPDGRREHRPARAQVLLDRRRPRPLRRPARTPTARLCEAGYAVVTPLQMDLTAHDVLPALREWKLES